MAEKEVSLELENIGILTVFQQKKSVEPSQSLDSLELPHLGRVHYYLMLCDVDCCHSSFLSLEALLTEPKQL